MGINTENLQFLTIIIGILTTIVTIVRSYSKIETKGKIRDGRIDALHNADQEILKRIDEKVHDLHNVDQGIFQRIHNLEKETSKMGDINTQIALLNSKVDHFKEWLNKIEEWFSRVERKLQNFIDKKK